jgi:NAD(P)-dependent dehydrogenase (short-subunit alcohol dehydrogenase family)
VSGRALENKTAIVTGASRGIGKAVAAAFVREGARVAVCGRKQETLQAVAEELGTSIMPVVCHVGRAAEIDVMIEAVSRRLGPVDVLVNNAGTNIAQGPCLEMTEAQFDKMIDINLKSAWRLMNRIGSGMVSRGTGSIINIASISGLKPQFHGMLYSLTKAALIMMTQSYALELGPSGVRINAIAPGLIQTALSEYYWKDEARAAAQMARQPIRHLGQPDEIAGLAVLLASDEGSYITGQTLVADGGSLLSSI